MKDQEESMEDAPRRQRLRTVAALTLPLAAIALFVRFLSPEVRPPAPPAPTADPAQNMDDVPPPPARVPEFPKGGPTPVGKVTLADLKFDTTVSRSAPFFKVGVRLAGDQLRLVDPESKKTLWVGPVSKASFVEEKVAAVTTIKDATGKFVWSNAKERAKPDLLLKGTSPGQAELRSKDGAVLWSGPFAVTGAGVRSRIGSEGKVEITTGSATFSGDNGAFTVTDSAGTLLWKGKLPVRPSILIRSGKQYHWLGNDGVESGGDTVSTIRYVSERGKVTVTDTKGKILGELPFALLRYEHQYAADPRAGRFPHLPRMWIPLHTDRIQLTRKGTVYLTFRDGSGRIFRRGKVYKADKQSGSMIYG